MQPFFGKSNKFNTVDYVDNRYVNLTEVANETCKAYKSASPFPNIVFENFFKTEMLDAVLSEFPDLSIGKTSKFDSSTEKKLAGKGKKQFGTNTSHFMKYLNSNEFLNFLQTLTDVDEKLIPDNKYSGGGLHEIKRGGFLKMHIDFNKHSKTKLDRRINVLIYLNKDWKEEYGGNLELWDRSMETCVHKILPVYNTMVIFSTTDYSYHGHPDPLNCPNDMSRKSLALYYYSDGRPSSELNLEAERHGTIFKTRNKIHDDSLDTTKSSID